MSLPHLYPHPTRIIRQGKATVLLFSDGTKSVVRLQEGERDDIYDAICIAYTKRFLGSGAEIKRLLDSVEYIREKPKVKRPKIPKLKPGNTPPLPFSAVELFHELFDEMQERAQ